MSGRPRLAGKRGRAGRWAWLRERARRGHLSRDWLQVVAVWLFSGWTEEGEVERGRERGRRESEREKV